MSYILIATLLGRLAAAKRDERGQTAVEYLGVIIVIAAIVAVLVTTDIGGAIGRAILDKIKDVAGT